MDTHQHHFDERAVFIGCGVRALEVNVLSEQELKVNLFAPKHYYTDEKTALIVIGLLK